MSKPKVGDLAWHVDGLDPRRVMKVSGEGVWLDILGETFGPYPIGNYEFTTIVGIS